MKYSEAELGRVFVIKMEDGDRLPSLLEEFANKKKIAAGVCLLVGGVKAGSRMVNGPLVENQSPIQPIINELAGVHEILAAGTIFPDEKGRPKLHMHASAGRAEKALTGCIRPGIEIWNVGEIILIEMKESSATRKRDSRLGFEMLST